MKMKRLAEKSKEGIQESEPKKRGWFLKIYHFFQDFVEREITLVQKISLCIPIGNEFEVQLWLIALI